jgi:hypothetical protein
VNTVILDPTRGYARWIISRDLPCNIDTWNAWIEYCEISSLHIKWTLLEVFEDIKTRGRDAP